MVAGFFASSDCWTVVGKAKAEEPKKDAVKKELDKLEGSWTLVSLESKGKKTPEDDVKRYHLTIKGDQWTIEYPGGKDKLTIQIDPGKDPKTIDFTFKAPSATVRSRGIYTLGSSTDGDTLTLCRVDQKGLPRPKEFKTTESTTMLFVWKRAPK